MDAPVRAVADGMYQVVLPLPFALRSVNCYVLEEAGGWTILDTGLSYAPSQEAWGAALGRLGIGWQSIRRIILSHGHPDHYGAAGWLQQHSGAPVLMSDEEQTFVRNTWQSGASSEREVVELFGRHGLPVALATQVRGDVAELRAKTQPAPELTTLEAGTKLQIGRRHFDVIATPGHSDGHLVFYCADEQLLLCADTVLIKITPNISLWPYGRPNPLADFLETLNRLALLQVALALPGHGPVITNFAARLVELRSHHDARLALIEEATGAGATAFTICSSIFPTAQFTSHQMRFAMAETLAHLEYLVSAGRMERVQRDTFVYRRVA